MYDKLNIHLVTLSPLSVYLFYVYIFSPNFYWTDQGLAKYSLWTKSNPLPIFLEPIRLSDWKKISNNI